MKDVPTIPQWLNSTIKEEGARIGADPAVMSLCKYNTQRFMYINLMRNGKIVITVNLLQTSFYYLAFFHNSLCLRFFLLYRIFFKLFFSFLGESEFTVINKWVSVDSSGYQFDRQNMGGQTC